jgi:SH3-like domain-containing protein
MLEEVQAALANSTEKYRDKRLHHCRLEVTALVEDKCVLSGVVLDEATLSAVTAALAARFPGLACDTASVQVLRQPTPQLLTVDTNVTGLYAEPSFQSEMMSQVLHGWLVEVLLEEERWAYIRQPDGYLGWVYRPYLAESPTPTTTHIVQQPVALLRCDFPPEASLTSRVLAGVEVQVTAVKGDAAFVILTGKLDGWLPTADLRPLSALPQDEKGRRQQMIQDAHRFTGVPYLWGGCTALGIDCSGLVQLLHQLVGVPLPRDADMQFNAGRPVEPPFQPGDLLFFGRDGHHRAISHVGMSLGGWRIIHSSRTRNGVYVDDVQAADWLKEIFVGARTFL